MRASIAIVLGSLFASQNTLAFVPVRNAHQRTLLRAAELKPEPEGGEELNKFSFSLPDSRLKNLGPDGGEGVYKFWLTAKADGKTIKKLRDQTEREASKKANFPGFRKVIVGVITRPVEISIPQGSRQFLCSIHFSILFNVTQFSLVRDKFRRMPNLR